MTRERNWQTKPCPTPDKQSYASGKIAKEHLDALIAKFGKENTPKPYFCECGLWHLGRRNGKIVRDRAERVATGGEHLRGPFRTSGRRV